MDEVPCYFDMPTGTTIDIRGAKNVPVTTSGYEKLRFTVVLACSADGGKLNPMLIFKNLKKVPKLPAGGRWPVGELHSTAVEWKSSAYVYMHTHTHLYTNIY